MTQKALDDVCRAALAVPKDRVEWSAQGHARSVLSQMQEIAMSGSWFAPIVAKRSVPSVDEHAKKEAASLRQSFDTIEKCIVAAGEHTAELCTLISHFPDSDLELELSLPFGPGITYTMADILQMHYWNMVYHLGQINFIQLMLGDKDMH